MFNNKNFYPTPDDLIDKMLDKLNLRMINSILDPSCGKGNILDRIKERTKDTHKYGKVNLFGIEIDNNLKAICKNKGYRILHNDFLTYDSFTKFSAIVMNPPFDAGDKHLLKAIELQERSGGKVVCLLNANTIKNDYSVYRKDLLRKLDKYNATIEFIEDAFLDAERKTGVEIALIYMDIPQQRENSVIIDGLKQEEKHEQANINNQIVSNDYITQIIQRYNFEIKAGVKLLNEYESIKGMLSRDFDSESPILEVGISGYKEYDIQNEFIRRIRYKYWTTLFQSKEFGKLFTSDIRSQFQDKLEELQEYDFSLYNIETIKLDMQLLLSDSLQNTIYQLFDDFIKYSFWEGYSGNTYLYDGWKTNEAHKLNEKKIIIPLNAYSRWDSNSFEPHYYPFKDKIRDIYKVFGYLDSGRTQIDDSLDEILKKAHEEGQTKNIDCGYFKITCYKKGTTHFEWTNKDLIKKLNIEGARGRNWIPPSYGKPYNDMSQEEKDVIDSFQGEKEYRKIMNDRDFYLNSTSRLLAITG